MPELTEEEKAESEARKKEFSTRYQALSDELQCDFGQSPITVGISTGIWGMAIKNEVVDLKHNGIPSPIQNV